VRAGQRVGTMEFWQGRVMVGGVPLVAVASVAAPTSSGEGPVSDARSGGSRGVLLAFGVVTR
jgi:hypothetical protein